MSRMSLGIAAASFMAATGIGITVCVQGQPWVGASLILAGPYLAAIILLDIPDRWNDPLCQFAALVITTIGIVGVFVHHAAFDLELQSAQIDAVQAFQAIDSLCRPVSPALMKVRQFGIAACTTQGNRDQRSAIMELEKGLHFGPGLSVIDGGAGLAKDAVPNRCAKAVKVAYDMCPVGFSLMKAAALKELLDAAK